MSTDVLATTLMILLLLAGIGMFIAHKVSDRQFNAERAHNESLRAKADAGEPVAKAHVGLDDDVTIESIEDIDADNNEADDENEAAESADTEDDSDRVH